MAPVTLEGDTLGEKHRHFNKLVKDAVADKNYELRKIRAEDSDINNLLKIDIACKTRNVDYVIEVMKSNDMLYAATAIKKSTWLITEQQYANIINPEYLHTQLAPNMNTKTFNKLMLYIRLNLKEESRVETFYEYLKESDSAYKWLEHCSIPFIQNVIKNERLIPLSLFKRLCRRSTHFLAYYTGVESRSINVLKNEILFLLKSHTVDVLDVLEDKEYDYHTHLGRKKTELVMKTCPHRILNNFENYADVIDLASVAKYLRKKNIRAFLHQHVRRLMAPFWYNHDTLKHFIKNMPKQERFDFVKKTFIDKSEMALLFSEEESRLVIESTIKPYQWYEFAPFDVALEEIKKLILKELSPSERYAMLSVLITCTQKNLRHIKKLLSFFNEELINEPFQFKLQFVNNLLSQSPTHRFGAETWGLLDQLFHSLKVYENEEYEHDYVWKQMCMENEKNDLQMCMESITLYKVLRDEPVPESIEQYMKWNSFEKIHRKLKQEQNSKMSKMFTYLLESALKKIESENIAEESGFRKTVVQIKNVLTLLRDWEKDISEFPFILEKIQELVKIKEEKMFKKDISCLYNVKKSWRKHMFEESLSLCLSEEVCLIALKHKPQLLTRHDKQIDALRTDDAVSLPRLLAKLRVYWPHSLAQHWVNAYRLNLHKFTGQKAVIKGLFMLLPQNKITDMATNYVPDNFKINWREADMASIIIQKNIASNLYLARPLISLDTVLLYARGNYFQFAVPSLNAILYNMSEIESREQVPKLLDAPVSLMKFGLHLVFFKLKTEELILTYSRVWNTTANKSIRGVLFRHTYERLCTVRNATFEKELWELLSFFLDYVFCGSRHAERVPISVRAEYFKQSYRFVSALPRSEDVEHYREDLINYASDIMSILDADFVADEMLSPAGSKFCCYESKFLEIFACYIIYGKSEEDQLQRFRRVVEPAMEEAFQQWDKMRSGRYYVRDNFYNFLAYLIWYFRALLTFMKIPMPAILFAEIKTKIETRLPVLKNYVLFTSFKLIAEYVKLFNEEGCISIAFEFLNDSESQLLAGQQFNAIENLFKHTHFKISPSLGPIIVKCLKEETELYGPNIYWLFSEAFERMFQLFNFQSYDMFVLETLKYMLNDTDFIPSYLVVSKVLPKHCTGELKAIQSEIRKKLKSHPSTIVQLQYYNDFQDNKQYNKMF